MLLIHEFELVDLDRLMIMISAEQLIITQTHESALIYSRRVLIQTLRSQKKETKPRGGYPVRAIFVRDFKLKLMMQCVSAYLIDAKTTHDHALAPRPTRTRTGQSLTFFMHRGREIIGAPKIPKTLKSARQSRRRLILPGAAPG